MEKLYDDLTGLYTFSGFQLRVEDHLRSHNGEYAIIRFDIENFKMVNNIFGFSAGDRLLSEIGEMLRTNPLPEMICCRVEGDNYCTFLKQENVQELVDRMLQKKFFVGKGYTVDYISQIEINIGIYNINDADMPVSVMCDRASMALGTIKDNHMERVAVYDENLYRSMVNEHELCSQLGPAIEEKQLKMYLQPQVDNNDTVLGAEALIRWEHPSRGLLMPGAFIPLFEKNYMIVQIDRYIWEQACILLKEWENIGLKQLYISVNVSPRDFECMDVYETLMGLVKTYRIDPRRLRIEITETTIMQNPHEQIKLVGRLREAGFYVEMDDFGSGYSSFSMLKDIKLDAIKLDMRFLSPTVNAERGKKILRTIISLSKDLNMMVIAEGVEREPDIVFLKSAGCDMFQGYYYARPMKPEDFEILVRDSLRLMPEMQYVREQTL